MNHIDLIKTRFDGYEEGVRDVLADLRHKNLVTAETQKIFERRLIELQVRRINMINKAK